MPSTVPTARPELPHVLRTPQVPAHRLHRAAPAHTSPHVPTASGLVSPDNRTHHSWE